MTNGKKLTPYLVLGAVVSMLLLGFSIITILGINDTVEAINQEELTYQANTKRLDELRLLARHEDQLRHAVSVMKRLIPQEAQESMIIDQINDFCEGLSANLIKIGFGTRVVNNSVNTMPLNMSFQCDYFSLIQLIREIASGKRLIRIDEISVSRNDISTNTLDIDIGARAFYR